MAQRNLRLFIIEVHLYIYIYFFYIFFLFLGVVVDGLSHHFFVVSPISLIFFKNSAFLENSDYLLLKLMKK